MTQVTCNSCGTTNNTSDMGYCWRCKAPLAAPAGSLATFATLEIAWPGFYLRFHATRERLCRVSEYILKEVVEAEAEFKAAKNQSQNDQDQP